LSQLPVWFHAIKGVSAVKSGIMNLPLILAATLFTIISGGGIDNLGYYGPFLLLSTVIASIGSGLLTTFKVSPSRPAWIGFQVIYGAGPGAAMQVAFVIVQAALPPANIPIATAIMTFAQTIGGAVFISVAQSVFSTLLIQNLIQVAPNVALSIVVLSGATELKNVIDKALLPSVLVAYNRALARTWFVSVVMAAVSIIDVVAID
jgi:hypothetical protein